MRKHVMNRMHRTSSGSNQDYVTGLCLSLWFLFSGHAAEAQEMAMDHVFYQTENLTVKPYSRSNIKDWCGRGFPSKSNRNPQPFNIQAIYTVEHSKREPLFSPKYAEFVRSKIVPEIRKLCGSYPDYKPYFSVNLQTQRKGETSTWDILNFRVREGSTVQTGYGGAAVLYGMTKAQRAAQIAAQTPPKVLDRLDTVLLTKGPVTIYPHNDYWCSTRGSRTEIDVVYDLPHEERDQWISSHYGATESGGYDAFFETEVYPALRKHCRYASAYAAMNFYRKGETERWDSMIMEPQRGLGITGLASVTIHSMSEKAKAYNTQAANEKAFGACTNKPFCDLLGGTYLNAIYKNDAALIQSLDRQILAEMRSTAVADVMKKSASILFGQETEVIGAEGFSLLKTMSIKYMALYGDVHIFPSCFLEGTRRMSRKSDIDIVEFEDQFGNDQGAVDIGFSHTYVINKEFIPLCNKICDAAGADGADFVADSLNSYKAKLILSGTSQVLSKLECNDPQVKQFERNLISLTEQYLKDPSARADLRSANVTPSSNLSTTNRTWTQTTVSQNTGEPTGARTRMAVIPAPVTIDEKARSIAFLAENQTKDGVIVTPSGLQYIIIAEGSGANPTLNDVITVHETGTLVDGTVVDNNYARGGQPYMSPLRTVMKGWAEGLQLIKTGGKIRLFIPAELAYGDRDVGKINAGAALIYEIELIGIN